MIQASYEMVKSESGEPGIKCSRCGLTSYNPNDIREKYCGNCHQFHTLLTNFLGYYILDGHTPVQCNDLGAWGRMMADPAKKAVKQEYVYRARVSTVFLGLEHGYGRMGGDSMPVLFETMIFECKELEGYQTRYYTWDEAVKGHNEAVGEVMALYATMSLKQKVQDYIFSIKARLLLTKWGHKYMMWSLMRSAKKFNKMCDEAGGPQGLANRWLKQSKAKPIPRRTIVFNFVFSGLLTIAILLGAIFLLLLLYKLFA